MKVTRTNQSVIIPAYGASKFIKRCLQSILPYAKDILIGVDGCRKTADMLIKLNYPVKVYWFPENSGPYVVRNTLMGVSQADRYLLIDADDEVTEKFFRELSGEWEVSRWMFKDVVKGNLVAGKCRYCYGAFGLTRKVFEKTGGFMPWRCHADAEFRERTEPHIETTYINSVVYHRRVHSKSISKRMSHSAKLRKSYKKYMESKDYTDAGLLKIKTVTAKCRRIL